MSFDWALRLSEMLLAFAIIQQSLEHAVFKTPERWVFVLRLSFGLGLLLGYQTHLMCWALFGLALLILIRFQGPYNGGSDRMGLLILSCLCLVHILPQSDWQEVVFGYLAAQLILSYVMSGWVKITNAEWRSGQALVDIFAFSAYPVCEKFREFAESRRLLWAGSWFVIAFELLFPLSLATPITLIIGLTITSVFHLANAFLFGLNRFFWTWIAAYPSIIWLQGRLFEAG